MGTQVFTRNVKSLDYHNIFIFVMILYVYITDTEKPNTEVLKISYNETLYNSYACHL